MSESPYIYKSKKVIVSRKKLYNPKYGDNRVCRCGHAYYRHFDPYENDEAVGCKYCSCDDFQEALPNIKRALVCGGASFIGSHLARYLKSKGYWVVCTDIKRNEFIPNEEEFCDQFKLLDLRKPDNCGYLFNSSRTRFDEIYQLVADMGGIGYINNSNGANIMNNNVIINANMLNATAENKFDGKYFFSSSVYVYPENKNLNSCQLKEEDCYPAMPISEYGWEKLYSERMVKAFESKYGFQARIARLENVYGMLGVWNGGKERAPAAICRKVAMVNGNDGEIEIWGDGKAVRSFAYIDDIVEGIYSLVQSDINTPTNIGSSEYVTVNDLVNTIIKVSGKNIKVNHIDGPIGSQSWNFSKEKIKSIGWDCKYSLEQGMVKLYPWILEQVNSTKLTEKGVKT